MEIFEDYLSIKPCNCSRPYCSFFGGGIGDYGQSFSREGLENLRRELDRINIEEVKNHLDKLLAEPEKE